MGWSRKHWRGIRKLTCIGAEIAANVDETEKEKIEKHFAP